MAELVFELIQSAATFLLFTVCYVFGVARERNRKPGSKPKAPLNLRCGCSHELAHHHGLGECGYATRRLFYNKNGTPVKKETEYQYYDDPCTCLQYTGDLPEDWFSRVSMRPPALGGIGDHAGGAA